MIGISTRDEELKKAKYDGEKAEMTSLNNSEYRRKTSEIAETSIQLRARESTPIQQLEQQLPGQMAKKDQDVVDQELPPPPAKNQPALPEGFRQLNTQVAGHNFESSNAEAIGLVQDYAGGCVLKPLGKPECGERELRFYESLAEAGSLGDNDLALLRGHVPRFYGPLKLVVNQRERTFLRLEDLTRDMLQPCVMDVKVGKRTWDPAASDNKRQVEEAKYVQCKQALGLCLPGFQVYLPVDHPDQDAGKASILRRGRDYGKSLSVEGFKETMALFFNASTSHSKSRSAATELLLQEVLRQLEDILKWFHRQRVYHFYASSLLICYDYSRLTSQPLLNGHHHNHGKQDEDDAPSSPASWVRVRMIDFAHVYPAEQALPDDNYMFGLRSLIEVIRALLNR